eukprot:TRINITY_DN17241_c0_g1_i1.p1 TRINITY_DN17241_c0_g1~~TRINITY_DN17241_c0_g1_i1.p1  ORF type:complete len:308 (+),score=27.07 TRINITY_DN17241_c0_g1_i1:98-1021(+)
MMADGGNLTNSMRLDVDSDARPVAALVACGDARRRLGDIRGAYEDFREAARMDPTNMAAWEKYEDAYRAAENLIADDHARLVKQDMASLSATHDLGNAGPPPFSFTLSSSESDDDSDGYSDDDYGIPSGRRSSAFSEVPSSFDASLRPRRTLVQSIGFVGLCMDRSFRQEIVRTSSLDVSKSWNFDSMTVSFRVGQPRLFAVTIVAWVSEVLMLSGVPLTISVVVGLLCGALLLAMGKEGVRVRMTLSDVLKVVLVCIICITACLPPTSFRISSCETEKYDAPDTWNIHGSRGMVTGYSTNLSYLLT